MIMLILGFLGWTGIAGLVRAQGAAERNKRIRCRCKSTGCKKKEYYFPSYRTERNDDHYRTGNNLICDLYADRIRIIILRIRCCRANSFMGEICFGTTVVLQEVISQYWWRWVFPSVVLGLCTKYQLVW